MNDLLNKKLLGCVLAITLLLLLRDLAGVAVNQLIILSLIGLAAIILPYDDLFCFTSFMTPLANGVNGYAFTILLLFLCIRAKKRNKSQIIPAVILIVIELLHSSAFYYPISNELLYFSYITLFFFCCNDRNDINASQVVKYFIYGASLCCLLIVGRTYITTGSFVSIFLDSARTGVAMGSDELELSRETHMALNANSLAYISLLGTSCLMIGRQLLSIGKIQYYALLFTLLFGGIITVGRTWILVMAIVGVLFVLSSDIKRKSSFALLLFVGVIIVSQTEALNSLFSVITDGFTDRFTAADLEEAGGRRSIWKEYMEIWHSDLSNVFIGISAPNYRLMYPQINAIHNVVQQSLVCTGLIGLIVYVQFFAKTIRQNIRLHTQFQFYLPMVGGLLYLQSISLLADWILILALFPCIYALRIQNDNKYENRTFNIS